MLDVPQRYDHRMRLDSPGLLAIRMGGDAGRSGGPASALLSTVRSALVSTHEYVRGLSETHMIVRFAHDHGFEYLSQTNRNGQQVCNFWRVPSV